MENVFKQIFYWMPFFFGIGFIAPLIAQTMNLWHWQAPFDLPNITFGLIIGGVWGLQTVIRGRWI